MHNLGNLSFLCIDVCSSSDQDIEQLQLILRHLLFRLCPLCIDVYSRSFYNFQKLIRDLFRLFLGCKEKRGLEVLDTKRVDKPSVNELEHGDCS